MSNTISDNMVVQFHYVLSNDTGEQLESSKEAGQPMTYLHGHHNIVAGLEKALAGKTVGDTFSVIVPPAEGYGPYQESAIGRVSIKHLKFDSKKLKTGDIAEIQTKDGPRFVVVTKAGKFMADVDGNHPFAGKTLHFDVEVADIRPASEDEISHGHSHGPGGHHH